MVSQGTRFKANRPVTSQVLLQLLDMLDEVTEELQCKESMEELAQWRKSMKLSNNLRNPPND